VDNGGDSLTGGIDFHEHVELGRDTQVGLALKQFQASGAGEYLHVVMGPGCDGESSQAALAAARDRLIATGQYVGSVDLVSLLQETFARTEILGDARTPNIMYNAAKLLREAPPGKRDELIMVVPRGKDPRPLIPATWLCSAWIFQDAPYCANLMCYEQAPCPVHTSGLTESRQATAKF